MSSNLNMVNSEQAVRERMLAKVAEMRGLEKELAQQKIENVIVNLPIIKRVVEATGFYYGLMPHEMTPLMRDELRKVGELFVSGSASQTDEMSFLDIGMDIFKCIAVEVGGEDYERWHDYLENDRWHIKNWAYRR